MYFWEILKATRANRGLYIASFVLVPCAVAYDFNRYILVLAAAVLILYSAFAILNGLKDADFKLPAYARNFAYSMILLSLCLGLSHWLIFACLLVEAILGYAYNNHARTIPFADAITLSLTHTFIPPFTASLLLGKDLLFALKVSFFLMAYYGLLVNIKNQRGYLEDAQRGYKTHATIFKHHRLITANFIDLGYIIAIVWYLAFDLKPVFMYFVVGMHFVKRIMINLVHLEQDLWAIEVHRMNIYTFVLAVIISQPAVHPEVLSVHTLIISIYILGLIVYTKRGDDTWKRSIRSLLARA